MTQGATLPDLQTTAAGGLTLAWREAGDPAAPALIFLHGIGSGSTGWVNQFGHFADRFRVIAWDAPGYGGSSDLPAATPPAADYADAMAALLDALGIGQAHFCGNSLGALMISAIAKRHGDRALSICLSDAASGHGKKSEADRAATVAARLDPLAELGAEEFAAQRARRLCGSRASEAVVASVQATMAQIRLPGYAQAARMLANGDIFDGLAGCAIRAMVVCGSEDVVTPPENNRKIAEFIGAPYREIGGAGHLPYVETPAEFNALLDDFLAQDARAAAE